jgi:hypothetical protein
VSDGGLDVEKLSLLGKWAEGLQGDPRAEVSASGKAILMLIEEIERLHVVIWDGRLNPTREPEPLETEPSARRNISTIFRRCFTVCATAFQRMRRDEPHTHSTGAATRPRDVVRDYGR